MSASRTFRYSLLTLIAVGLIGGASLFFRHQEESHAAQEGSTAPHPVELAEVEITRVAPADRMRVIRINGSLQPIQRTQLNAKVSGTLATLQVDVGDPVNAGDVLAQFDTKDLRSVLDERRASLSALKAQYEVAQTTLQRTRQLNTQGYSPKSSLDQAESEVLQLRAQLQGVQAQMETAEKALKDAVVVAPFSGVIASRPVENGQTVAMNTELMTVVDLSRMELAAKVPTSRIAEVTLGQKAQLQVEGYGDRPFEAEVTRISPVAEANARTVPVYLQVNNDDKVLRGGLFVTGQLRIEVRKDIIIVPLSAVRKDDGGDYVLKIVDGTLEHQNVTRGTLWQEESLVQIEEGLQAGDTVVSATLPELKAGLAVKIAGSGDPESGSDAASPAR